MLKILFNKDSNDEYMEYELTILKSFMMLSAKNTDPAYLISGKDSIEALDSYNSYIFVNNNNSIVKSFRIPTKSSYKFLNMNRLGVSLKMDFSDLTQLYSSGNSMCQIDTGIISNTERDIIIRFFMGSQSRFKLNTDMDVEYGEFSSRDLPSQVHPRSSLWDSYAIKIGDRLLKANRYGTGISGNFETPISYKEDHIPIEIYKYQGDFKTDTKLTRDIDCEDVLIDSSCGVLDTKRVTLSKGYGKINLYPFNYSGKLKLKLGRKWYEVWNEYNLILEKKL